MSSQEIVNEVNKYPIAPLVVLTGGEPSLFIDEAFVAELKQKTGKMVATETNGTRLCVFVALLGAQGHHGVFLCGDLRWNKSRDECQQH